MRLAAFIFLGLFVAAIPAGAVSRNDVLFGGSVPEWAVRRALAEVESGHLKFPDRARGASGEISRFQILPKVWHQYSRSRRYTDPLEAWSVARQILRERETWFHRLAGRSPTPFELYVLWNKPGLFESVGFERDRLPKTVINRADRFQNLVEVIR